MAIIKRISSKATVGKLKKYLIQEEKTEEKLISGINCTTENLEREFKLTKELYDKRYGVQYHHVIQSFSPEDNINFEEAHKLGQELAENCFKGFEVFVVTHKDKEHVHNHLVVNSVSLETGLKYNASNKSLWDIKRESNKICEREKLNILDLEHKAKEMLTSGELRKELRGEETWKGELKECIRFAKENTSNVDEFTRYLKSEFNIDTRITKKTISYKHPNKEKPIRGSKLGADYDKEELINEFIRKEKSINSRERTFSKGEIERIKRNEQTGAREQSFERNFDRVYGSIGAVERRAKQFSIKTREEEQRAREESERIRRKQQDVRKEREQRVREDWRKYKARGFDIER